MTHGSLLYTAGWILLGLTILLAIFFFIKKPVYPPENEASGESLNTQKLRNAYLTEQVTKRREEETEKIELEALTTEKLDE